MKEEDYNYQSTGKKKKLIERMMYTRDHKTIKINGIMLYNNVRHEYKHVRHNYNIINKFHKLYNFYE